MAEYETETERRAASCPKCAEHRGTPTAITYGKGRRTLSLECPNCGHKWDVQTEFPEPERLP